VVTVALNNGEVAIIMSRPLIVLWKERDPAWTMTIGNEWQV